MKMRSLFAVANTTLVLVTAGIPTEAAEIKVLSAGGMRPVMEDLGPKFERESGHKLSILFAFAGEILRRIQGGESADVVIIPQADAVSLVKDGKTLVDNTTLIARAGIGIAIGKGAPKPDVSSPEALKRTLLAANSIAYGDPAQSASGSHFAKVLDRLGIANEMKPKSVVTKTPGEIGALVANGGVEIGVNQMQDFVLNPDVEIAGPLPSDLQNTVIFSAVIFASAENTVASKALINFLRSPGAAAVIRAKGLEPATP